MRFSTLVSVLTFLIEGYIKNFEIILNFPNSEKDNF